jgi:hypothetical protein
MEARMETEGARLEERLKTMSSEELRAYCMNEGVLVDEPIADQPRELLVTEDMDIVPICGLCKKVRVGDIDEDGVPYEFWRYDPIILSLVKRHNKGYAQSHGLCPACESYTKLEEDLNAQMEEGANFLRQRTEKDY